MEPCPGRTEGPNGVPELPLVLIAGSRIDSSLDGSAGEGPPPPQGPPGCGACLGFTWPQNPGLSCSSTPHVRSLPRGVPWAPCILFGTSGITLFDAVGPVPSGHAADGHRPVGRLVRSIPMITVIRSSFV